MGEGGHDEEVASSKKQKKELKTRVMTKMAAKLLKLIPLIYDQNGSQNHTLWGRTHLYSPYRGVTPPL